MPTYDLIVIGAGAIGSAAAYHAERRGQRVLLLEQFEIDHQRGSSYGISRIIRYSYDHPHYIRMSKIVYPMWRALEEDAGEQLMIPSGGVDIGKQDTPDIHNRVISLTAERIPYEILSPEEMRHRYPQFRLDDDQVAMYQADTGILRASRCVRAQVQLAEVRGAVVRAGMRVESIAAVGDGVQVRAGGETFEAARLILAAGGWANDLLGQVGIALPLQVQSCQENYFDAQPEREFEPGRFPAFIAYSQAAWGTAAYGIPSVDGSGLKVAWHGGLPVAHAGESKQTPDADVSDKARAWSKQYLPAGDVALKSSRVCLYTMTPDEHFVIDRHPSHPQIVIGACCSGHAFKYSTLIGDILVDLAVEGETSRDIEMFAMSRFNVPA
jgi:monomeric sarcosine oxidase